MSVTWLQFNKGLMLKITSCVKLKLLGQIENVVIPLIKVFVHPVPADKVDKLKLGVLGGIELAVTVIDLIDDAPFGSLRVNCTV